MTLTYKIGDATQPQGDGLKVIAHVCNNAGAFGAGFAAAVRERWPHVAGHYFDSFDTDPSPQLGKVQFVEAEAGIVVANMIAQDGLPSAKRRCALDYDALTACLITVGNYCDERFATVHAPRFGSGIAGGHWPAIVKLIIGTLGALDVPITIYDLPPKAN